jgi:hypothetical protein
MHAVRDEGRGNAINASKWKNDLLFGFIRGPYLNKNE